MFVFGAWLEASALVNSDGLEKAGHYVAEFIKNKSTLEQASYIIGLSKANYMKKAFETERIFRDFVKNNKKISSIPIAKNPTDEMINTGIQYAVNLIEGKE